MSRDDATVAQVLAAARLAREFVQGLEHEAFTGDPLTRSAVLYQLLVIGEAAKRLSDSFKEQHAEIPWRAVAGMRDKLIHGYDIVDVDAVWHTVQTDIPALLHVVEPLVPADES